MCKQTQDTPARSGLPIRKTIGPFQPLSYLLLLLAALTQSFAASTTGIRVIDEAAIAYTEFLPKAEFDQRFPGEIKADLADLETGWYVIYQHESLNYYFGPILLQSTGKDYLVQLSQIVESAVAQRPEIKGYRLALLFDPAAGESSGTNDDTSDSNTIIIEEEPTEAPAQRAGILVRIRRFFGF